VCQKELLNVTVTVFTGRSQARRARKEGGYKELSAEYFTKQTKLNCKQGTRRAEIAYELKLTQQTLGLIYTGKKTRLTRQNSF